MNSQEQADRQEMLAIIFGILDGLVPWETGLTEKGVRLASGHRPNPLFDAALLSCVTEGYVEAAPGGRLAITSKGLIAASQGKRP